MQLLEGNGSHVLCYCPVTLLTTAILLSANTVRVPPLKLLLSLQLVFVSLAVSDLFTLVFVCVLAKDDMNVVPL